MGRERSARVSAVGRRANLVLGTLQGAAVTRGLAFDALSVAQKERLMQDLNALLLFL